MQTLRPEEFLKELERRREAAWTKMAAERRSYGAEKPLTRDVILRRLQFGVVMERRAGEITARWIPYVPDIDIQRPLSEYVANELKHASILRARVQELGGDPDALWDAPLPELAELWQYHSELESFPEVLASVQYGHEEFFPRTSKSFIERVEAIDAKTAAIYRDTLLGDEAGHEWLAPEALRRYALDGKTQARCFEALDRGCELFARAIHSFNRTIAS